MAGWDAKSGSITAYDVSEDRYWSLFNYVFSDSCRKRNTYKFGLIKSILDNLFNMTSDIEGMQISYEALFGKFAENYWNLVVKYDLRQMRRDGKSQYSKVETILKAAVSEEKILTLLDFEALDEFRKQKLVKEITTECKKYVVGALYEDFEGTLYGFNLSESSISINHSAYAFMLKYKSEIEKLNYYSWAKFLEKVNDDNALIRVIDKLELATPRRSDLSIYREILRKEFEENTCFYCGKKLQGMAHVDHFIPWSFTKDDKIWNFVLACPTCNERKNNRIPVREYLVMLEQRNKKIKSIDNTIIRMDFTAYDDNLLERMWHYAKLSGLKEYRSREVY